MPRQGRSTPPATRGEDVPPGSKQAARARSRTREGTRQRTALLTIRKTILRLRRMHDDLARAIVALGALVQPHRQNLPTNLIGTSLSAWHIPWGVEWADLYNSTLLKSLPPYIPPFTVAKTQWRAPAKVATRAELQYWQNYGVGN